MMLTGSTNFREFTCVWCEMMFSRYVPPSDSKGHRDFCSRRCQAKHAKNSHLPPENRSGTKSLASSGRNACLTFDSSTLSEETIARTSSAPVFEGVRLRSLLEQRAIEFLVARDDLTFSTTLVYEVKPAWKVSRPSADMDLKRSAVLASGMRFSYITDADIESAEGQKVK